MSSDEEKCSLPVVQNDSDRGSSVSSDLQEEYEELLRYAIVTPNIESGASQPSHSKGEVVPDVRIPTIIDDILDNQAGNSPVVRETRMEVGKGCDLNISSRSKTDGSSPVSSPRKPSHPVMDFFSTNLLGDSSSPGSNSSPADVHEIVVSDYLVSDENLQKMENVLDLWSSDLKTNVISELSKWRLNFIDWHRMEMKKEKEKHAAHIKQLCNQIDSLKELQKAYEVSIGRKDEVISSLSHALGKQKERIELMRTFFHWRIGHVKSRQDLSGALENAKAEIQRMQHEKEHFEDSMRKAFMRGVCALNLEAMTIFQNRGDTGIDFANRKEEYGPGVQENEPSAPLDPSAPLASSAVAPPQQLPPAAVGAASAAAFPSAAAVTPARTASASSLHLPAPAPLGAGPTAPAAPEEMYVPRVVTSAQQKAGRTITARITGRCDFASKNRISSSLAIMGVSPPMSSVVVEKHHPVTVQTIPQAAAAKYPRTIHPESGPSASRSLGARPAHTQPLTSAPSIKVVD
ncbi:centrosomal protein POC5 isoform X4 [Diceros bicornis minor]|uniref:centrosomal protein POC5 isoform X4 n=1 Tax=Diceros bicornis minor TaxID=77932 RepID=UPI0026EB7E27|nr:centrosomal protein POC5 isoform X4 [Diceros bicornis minor]